MFRKTLLASLAGCILAASAAMADVVVRIGPPPPVVERRGPPPGRGYVWTPGYQRWDGRGYRWETGRWAMPPRGRSHWVPGKWKHHHGEWVFVEGHWR
jgi:hypothetical protein